MEKRLIFTVTPGRSGTAYLAKLLETVPTVSAHHEPEPNFVQAMRKSQTNPLVAYTFLLNQKLPAIRQTGGEVYAETSHLTCKGFIEPMIRMGLRPSLIVLRRPPREVAWSYFSRGTIPGRTTGGIYFLLDPRDFGVLPLLNWDEVTEYQLCYWYALEIERRQRWYAQMAFDMDMTVVDVTHRELNDWDTYRRLLSALDLPLAQDARDRHALISAQPHNPNTNVVEFPDYLEAQEQAVWEKVIHYQPLLLDHIERRYAPNSQRNHDSTRCESAPAN